jgi:hypothetical protein
MTTGNPILIFSVYHYISVYYCLIRCIILRIFVAILQLPHWTHWLGRFHFISALPWVARIYSVSPSSGTPSQACSTIYLCTKVVYAKYNTKMRWAHFPTYRMFSRYHWSHNSTSTDFKVHFLVSLWHSLYSSPLISIKILVSFLPTSSNVFKCITELRFSTMPVC